MSRTSLRVAATILAILLGCLTLSAASASAEPMGKHHVKLTAAPVKSHVHKGEQVRIHGHLASVAGTGHTPMAATTLTADDLYLQEETSAGVWVNLDNTGCYPDDDFDFNLSFSVSASLTLRIFAPETDMYAAAYSDVFALVVL